MTRETKDLLWIIVAFVVGGAIIFSLIQRGRYITEVARANALRADVAVVGCSVGEDVLGQVTGWNQDLAEYQRWNEVPVIQMFVPNGWDTQTAISVERCQ